MIKTMLLLIISGVCNLCVKLAIAEQPANEFVFNSYALLLVLIIFLSTPVQNEFKIIRRLCS